MIMSERKKKKKRKNGFTLVELVIVIAILAILAGIAIPVITTTINASKKSVLDSDRATIEMVMKEALSAYRTEIKYPKYNSKAPYAATVSDVLVENQIDPSVMSIRRIGGKEYCIYWDNLVEGAYIKSGTGITEYNLSTRVASLGSM